MRPIEAHYRLHAKNIDTTFWNIPPKTNHKPARKGKIVPGALTRHRRRMLRILNVGTR
jgi:hypothetical protein